MFLHRNLDYFPTVKTEGVNGELLKSERKFWSGKRRPLQIPEIYHFSGYSKNPRIRTYRLKFGI